ncbi:MAG: LysR family transcriptional regulator [Eubacteriales bacterium]|nr:LysR family transcriptional regulator [Eubacteriales bacterium]
MIELYILRQFAAFAEAGTLSEAAEVLHLSQPALSRNMKKLEEDLGIPLFERRKNKLELNENGDYVLEMAQKLLEEAEAFTEKAREFDRKKRTITLGVCAPAPIWRLAPLIANQFPHMSLQTEMDSEEQLQAGLENNAYQLIVTHQKPEGTRYYWKECGRETLLFALPKTHRYAKRKSLSFSEMNGENMLLMSDIGFWDFVKTEKMPDSRFLTQSDRFSFNELVQASSLPSFTSDLAEKYEGRPSGRIRVPIEDEEAVVTYYLVCRPENRQFFAMLFASL